MHKVTRITIRDKDINDSNYGKFKGVRFVHKPQIIAFTYFNNKEYLVSLKTVLSWFDLPHYIFCNNKLRKWKEGHPRRPSAKIKKITKILDSHALRLYLDDNTVYDIAWDTVLMAVEPQYEWYGGLPSRG